MFAQIFHSGQTVFVFLRFVSLHSRRTWAFCNSFFSLRICCSSISCDKRRDNDILHFLILLRFSLQFDESMEFCRSIQMNIGNSVCRLAWRHYQLHRLLSYLCVRAGQTSDKMRRWLCRLLNCSWSSCDHRLLVLHSSDHRNSWSTFCDLLSPITSAFMLSHLVSCVPWNDQSDSVDCSVCRRRFCAANI